ncbi:hypothetical protein A2223_02450 [Candidatus Falkowbacteria bacterium RIFOXYA2_FULL_35_8]|uniref:Lipoprotein signal peptidase n=1 Tax=Candidatus Falkowbacteria bacterium RIFOXYC2_FULL_36_12 TaxID=1798002 RepID=A0A1F5T4P4_9BACT|nr:MAG: hypothetical protein A2300_01800 [Candidatus Falkowbacteria bacterium RIFOXYB2_FULL_35_7]OGF33421.1 MAG: hypothetical protein A2478_01850 [Candidatus Falkowbacteria bacterium RIFOXYC2_FULL_36_12]OGF33893.1 MAG: hypothetical protein A2223_02450 [Candidatus Falkowbacteria bacterium RIFOXYA2_FULL_35_8]
MTRSGKFIVAGVLSSVTLLIDRITKYYVIDKLPVPNRVFVFRNNFFSIDLGLSINNKLALSIPMPQIIIIGLIIIILILVSLLLYREILKNNCWYSVGFAIIFGAAVSNLVDRFIYNGVIDFVQMNFFNITGIIFNLADAFIIGGILIILISEFNNIKLKYENIHNNNT